VNQWCRHGNKNIPVNIDIIRQHKNIFGYPMSVPNKAFWTNLQVTCKPLLAFRRGSSYLVIAEIRPIAKPGKPPNSTSSFRPISLLSCIGKLVERQIHERLAHFLESNHLLHQAKAGFAGTGPWKSKSWQSLSLSMTASNREGHLYTQLSFSQTSPELMIESGERRC